MCRDDHVREGGGKVLAGECGEEVVDFARMDGGQLFIEWARRQGTPWALEVC